MPSFHEFAVPVYTPYPRPVHIPNPQCTPYPNTQPSRACLADIPNLHVHAPSTYPTLSALPVHIHNPHVHAPPTYPNTHQRATPSSPTSAYKPRLFLPPGPLHLGLLRTYVSPPPPASGLRRLRLSGGSFGLQGRRS
ncbi:uncharacterized protein LOC134765001 [Penaeus indicus]|uniref:uncharacterized protein LOC134765001 n=1 Tax=Penaeus indicus TaxID=29960 RepID=UPI00300C5AF2